MHTLIRRLLDWIHGHHCPCREHETAIPAQRSGQDQL